MSTSELSSAVERTGALGGEPVARRVEPLTSEHPEAVPATAPASPTAVLIGSVAFGLLFLLAWQFVPPALGVRPTSFRRCPIWRASSAAWPREHLTAPRP